MAQADPRRVSRFVWKLLVPFVLVLAVLAVVVMIRENVGGDGAAAAGDTVRMARIAFNPGELTVAQGTEVTFDNADVAPHTVTADDGSADSGILDPGKAFKLVVSQLLEYHCEVHPSMKGRILVEG